MLQSTLEILYLLLPAMAANMAPVFATHGDWLPGLNRPIDAGLSINRHRLLGDNKTIRGLIFGILFGSIIGIIQYGLSDQSWTSAISLIDYSSAPGVIVFAAAISLGALIGDAVESLIKRRLGKTSGESWSPFDQVDFAIGALAFAALYTPITFSHIISAIIFIGLGSYLVSHIGVSLKIKKTI